MLKIREEVSNRDKDYHLVQRYQSSTRSSCFCKESIKQRLIIEHLTKLLSKIATYCNPFLEPRFKDKVKDRETKELQTNQDLKLEMLGRRRVDQL